MKVKFLVPFCLIFFCFSVFPTNVVLERALLRTGVSPRLKDYSWAEVRAVLKNPQNENKRIRLRLISDDNFLLVKSSVFEYELNVPANSILEFVGNGMSEASESYRVEIYENGIRTGISDNFLVDRIVGGRQKRNIVILSDDVNISLGSVAQLPEFKQQLYQTAILSKNCPSHYGLYLPFDCIIILRPDYNRLTEKQIKAIIDYVASGGKIIFADPLGIIEASKTPLADLLPVIPLQIKKINRSEILSSYFRSFKNWRDYEKYTDFLDSVIKDNSNIILSEGASPLFTSLRYGAGNVICSSIQLTEENFKDTGFWVDIVKFAFINPLETESHQGVIESLDSLTGITIPSIKEIRRILLFFLLPAFVIIVGGYFCCKGHLAWFFLAFFSILYIFWIFRQADQRIKLDRKILLAGIETEFNANGTCPFEDFYSLYSRNDEQVNIAGFNDKALLSGIPPEGGGSMQGLIKQNFNTTPTLSESEDPSLRRSVISEPIEVRFEDGRAKIVELLLKANSTRKFCQLGSNYSNFSKGYAKIYYEDRDIYLSLFNFHDELKKKFDQAYVILPGGIFTVTDKYKTLSFGSDRIKLEKMQVPLQLVEALRKEFSLPMPVLALLSFSKMSRHLKSEYSFGTNTVFVDVYPISEPIGGERVFSPFERTMILPADQSTRMFLRDLRNLTVFSIDDIDYRFRFRLPEYFSFAYVDRIEVSFDFICDSGNILLTPVLLKNNNYGGQTKTQTVSIIPHSEKRHNTYIFSGEQLREVVDLSGCGTVELQVRIKRKDLPIEQKSRDNLWTLRDFKISASGQRIQSVGEKN